MKSPLLPPRGTFVVTALLFDHSLSSSLKETLMEILALAWSSPLHETPPLSLPQLSSLTGKSIATLHGHLTVLRTYRSALRLRPAGHRTLVFSLADWLFISAPEWRLKNEQERSENLKLLNILVNSREEQEEEEGDSSISLPPPLVINLKTAENAEFLKKGEKNMAESELIQISSQQIDLSEKVSKALVDAGIFSFLFNEVAKSGRSEKDLLALLAWCENDYPERPGGIFMARLRAGAAIPNRFYGERCDVCGKVNGHSETCQRRYESWLVGRSSTG